ncbi:hypothetical protein CU664_11630 [Pseudomonas syringae pv. actinidifoliorum]|uniref:hypothetical protein n=1 Tax=Pseudomonas syringae TaxID=317 RepID=UPI0013735BFC|nr:hypothetical protein [Pseudomonas syringae]NAS95006.1 hypothetical protein [Pseudomonas syringae pv. actinidifoliorum]NAT63886.1 hypothetical protein [Pseudomonas syringae pv. actinidifoliorum]
MRRNKKPEINFIDWGGKIVGAMGVLAMAAYVAGYAKFYFFYSALNCTWVLSMHSVQDVIANGAFDIVLCSATAIPLFFGYKSSVEIDNNGRRIVAFLLVGVVLSLCIGILLFDYKLNFYAADLIVYGGGYLFYGVLVAITARYSIEEGSYQYLMIAFLGFVMVTIFASYLVHREKTFSSVNKKGGFSYSVVGADGRAGILIGSVNGKYLVHVCEEADRYQMIIPSERWTVEGRGADSCLTPHKF